MMAARIDADPICFRFVHIGAVPSRSHYDVVGCNHDAHAREDDCDIPHEDRHLLHHGDG